MIMKPYNNFLFGLISLLVIDPFLGEATSSERDEVYIVYMGKTTSSVMNGDRFDPRNDHAQLLNELHTTRNEDVVVHVYNKSFLGLAARMSKEKMQSLAQRPQVVSVFPNQAFKLHTTRSWDFLMTRNAPDFGNSNAFVPTTSPHHASNLSFRGAYDTIVGIIDTGIWPEHPSFNDEYMSQVPTHWNGTCMSGQNATDVFKCNKKVIGARYYENPDDPGSIITPMDGWGHGTHVSSIVAGIPVEGASFYGLAKGIARGGSRGSRIAAYRVCGTWCSGDSILKAFDDAIDDGVDVITISIGMEFRDFFNDVISIGAFHAAEKGILVVGSAGNDGPSPMKVQNFAPWMLSVGATTIDRDFDSSIVLGAPYNKKIKGGAINFSNLSSFAIYPLIDGRSAAMSKRSDVVFNASYCIPGSLDVHKVKGKIVLCEDSDDAGRFAPRTNGLENQGAIGIIFINNDYFQSPYYYGTFPTVIVTVDDGAKITSYIETNKKPLATIMPTVETPMNYMPAPVVADFSSRGPIKGIETLLKPDVVAPGVGIVAAWLPRHDRTMVPGKEPQLFSIESGTSVSCPHVSSVAATVKSFHPKWSLSAIRSAIMTTATHANNLHASITTFNRSKATPYDIGAGEISLCGPLWPGLVYETETIDYVHFLCNIGYNTTLIQMISSNVPDDFVCPGNSSPDLISDMNYPSMAVSGLKRNQMRSVKRTVTNVGEEYSTYQATVEAPPGVQVRVVPNKLRFTKNVKKLTFEVTFLLTSSTEGDDLFGALTWFNSKHKVRSSFVVAIKHA